MKSRAPLALMEQMVMLLVFALAAALCLQAFVRSDNISRQSEARDRAAMLVQSAAEAIQSYGGDACDAFAGAAELLGGEAAGLLAHPNNFAGGCRADGGRPGQAYFLHSDCVAGGGARQWVTRNARFRPLWAAALF